MGHEPAGIVTEVADKTDAQLLGSKVVAQVFTGCGTCKWCHGGDQRLCVNATASGVIGRWGAFAEYVSVPATSCLRIPDGIESATAASLVDAGSTAANAWRTARSFTRANDPSVVVVGAGPVGISSPSWRVRMDMRRSSSRRTCCGGRRSKEPVSTPLRRWTMWNARLTSSSTAPVARRRWPGVSPPYFRTGALVAAGYSVVPELDLAPLARKELRVVGVRSGSRSDLEHILGAVAVGAISRPPITAWPLDQINEALAALRRGEVAGKAVIAMSPSESIEPTEVPTWTS